MASIISYLLTLLVYLLCKFKQLKTDPVRNRVGAAYENLAVNKVGRPVLAFLFLSFARRIAISYVITFVLNSQVAQLCFVNFSSLLMMAFVGHVRPYLSRGENRLELANEFTLLVLYCHLVSQTEFVQDMEGRRLMGWSLICLTLLSIVINFGNILVQDLMTLCRKIKIYFLKSA